MRVVSKPEDRRDFWCVRLAGKLETIFGVVSDVPNNLLCQSASKRPMYLLWSRPPGARLLTGRTLVSVQLAETEVGGQ